MDELQNIKTAIHEIAHATLHDTALAMPELSLIHIYQCITGYGLLNW